MATQPTQRYLIVDLGILPGGSVSVARAISNNVTVVGEADVDGAFHAFKCNLIPSRSGVYAPVMQDMGTLGGSLTFGKSIDANGRVVGYGTTATGANHAFYWPGAGRIQDLGPLGGNHSFATGVSVQSGVVGMVEKGSDTYRGFITRDGQIQELGTLGGQSSAAAAVNEAGSVVGDAGTAAGVTHAFLLSNGHMLDLGTLGGKNSSATAINSSGQVVGTAETAGGARHAFFFSNGQMQDLGTLGGATSTASAINTTGHVVGTSESAGVRPQAFLYDGALNNLNGLLPPNSDWELLAATGINDYGQIVGFGIHHGAPRGFFMTPSRS